MEGDREGGGGERRAWEHQRMSLPDIKRQPVLGPCYLQWGNY